MLPKTRRLPTKLFKTLLLSRKFVQGEHFTLRLAAYDSPRVAVSVSKKISKSAPERNRIKRRVYSSLPKALPNALMLFIAKAGAEKVKGEKLIHELAEMIEKSYNH